MSVAEDVDVDVDMGVGVRQICLGWGPEGWHDCFKFVCFPSTIIYFCPLLTRPA